MSDSELPSAASSPRRWPVPPCPSLRIDDDGLTLGAGSRLARMEGGTRRLALDVDRVLALLSVAYRRPVGAGVLVHIAAAAAHWRAGDAALANIRLALARFPRLDDPIDAARLRLAEYCLDEGLSPHALVRELGLESEALGKYGYDPDEPRDARGRWTDEPGVRFVVDDATDRSSARRHPIVVASSEQRPPPGSLPPKEDATADVPGTAFEAPRRPSSRPSCFRIPAVACQLRSRGSTGPPRRVRRRHQPLIFYRRQLHTPPRRLSRALDLFKVRRAIPGTDLAISIYLLHASDRQRNIFSMRNLRASPVH